MSVKDYYQILGVSPEAEDFVIRAAYKALVQRYHPDRYSGTQQDAHEKIREVNEAYETLSSETKRRDYDQLRARQTQQSKMKTEETPLQKEWRVAVEYYPDLTEILSRLALFSESLVDEYKAELLKSKQFAQRQELASGVEQAFLEDFFGNNPKVLDFARRLLLAGKKQAAKELNEALRVLGNGAPVDEVIRRIEDKYLPEFFKTQNKYDEDGYTPLMRAVLSLDSDKVKSLLDMGADPSLKDGTFGTTTALSIAKLQLTRVESEEDKKKIKQIIAYF